MFFLSAQSHESRIHLWFEEEKKYLQSWDRPHFVAVVDEHAGEEGEDGDVVCDGE